MSNADIAGSQSMDSKPSNFPISGGTQGHLKRALAPRHIAMITFGGVIGAGLFVGSSASIRIAGPAIVLSYLVAGAVVYAVMRMIGELASRFKGLQAFTDLVRAAMGDNAGFVVGWLYWYLWVIVLAIEAWAGGAILHAWVSSPSWLLSVGLMLIMMCVNLLPSRSFGEFEFWFSLVKVLAIVAFIAASGAAVFGTQAGRQEAWLHLAGLPGGFTPNGWSAVLAGIVSVFFSLTGAELTTIAAVEAKDPGSKQPKVASILVGRIILFYVLSIFLIVCTVSWRSVVPGTSPFTTALSALGFHWAGTAMTLVILTAVLSCLNSAFFISSRVLFGLSAHGDAPKQLVRLTKRGVPVRSVLLVGLSASGCLAAASLSPDSAFSFLVNSSGCLMLFIYSAICLAYGRSYGANPRKFLPGRILAVVTGAAMLGLMITMGMTPELAPQLYTGMFTLLFLFAIVAMRRRWDLFSHATNSGR